VVNGSWNLADPTDRLVLADWMEDRGHSAWAERLRRWPEPMEGLGSRDRPWAFASHLWARVAVTPDDQPWLRAFTDTECEYRTRDEAGQALVTAVEARLNRLPEPYRQRSSA
jgi:hypothetical protein